MLDSQLTERHGGLDAVLSFLEQHKGARFALLCHPRPDGDALGSIIGLSAAMRTAGHTAMAVNAHPVPDRLQYLLTPENHRLYQSPDWYKDYDVVGILDCGDLARLDPVNVQAAKNLTAFTIDHHASSRGVGDAVWIEPDASSVGEMVVRLCAAAGWRMTPEIATALWTAIVTDTGRFSYSNATVSALEAAADCVKAGVNPVFVAGELYQSVSVPERRLQGETLSRMELHAGGKLALSWLFADDYDSYGANAEEDHDMIDLLRDTTGVEVALFLYELNNKGARNRVKVSIRSREPHSALDVATAFGGGGHMRAAGCSLDQPLADARITILDAAMKAYFP